MPLRFAGQYSDDEVGLFYNYFRFYNPETGRYVENDPIDLQGGLNRYGYVGGSPLHAVDPYGLWWMPGDPIPQDSYEVLIGYSDSLSMGLGKYARNILNIDANVDYCSFNYHGGRVLGTAFNLLLNAYGAIPKNIIHFTTAKGATGIAESGIIIPSKTGLFGGGIYASSIPKSVFVPKNSTIPINIENTHGFVRVFPRTFLKPTTGLWLIPWNIGYAGLMNLDISISMYKGDYCDCE